MLSRKSAWIRKRENGKMLCSFWYHLESMENDKLRDDVLLKWQIIKMTLWLNWCAENVNYNSGHYDLITTTVQSSLSSALNFYLKLR